MVHQCSHRFRQHEMIGDYRAAFPCTDMLGRVKTETGRQRLAWIDGAETVRGIDHRPSGYCVHSTIEWDAPKGHRHADAMGATCWIPGSPASRIGFHVDKSNLVCHTRSVDGCGKGDRSRH